MKFIASLIACAFLGLSMGASAHHSAAAYDLERRIEIKGEVVRAMFRNPHGTLRLKNTVSEGYDHDVWEIETAAANLLRRRGWDFREVKRGMKVTVTGHATKDGSNHLYLREIYFEDGRVFGDPDGQDKSLD